MLWLGSFDRLHRLFVNIGVLLRRSFVQPKSELQRRHTSTDRLLNALSFRSSRVRCKLEAIIPLQQTNKAIRSLRQRELFYYPVSKPLKPRSDYDWQDSRPRQVLGPPEKGMKAQPPPNSLLRLGSSQRSGLNSMASLPQGSSLRCIAYVFHSTC